MTSSIMRAPYDAAMTIVQGFVNKLRSFFTARCPICRFRHGVRIRPRARDGFFGRLWILTFECRGCNKRFRAFTRSSD